MYHNRVIKRNLDQIANSLPFTLTRHTFAQVDGAVKHFNDRRDQSDGPLTYTREEEEWIENENILCKYDFNYYLTHYYWIKSTLGSKPGQAVQRVMRFIPNIAQKVVLRVWGEAEGKDQPVMLMQNKARQVGVTSLTEAAIAHRVQFYQNVNALIASSSDDKTRAMAGKMEFAWRRMPFWLMPDRVRGPLKSGELLVEFPDLDSGVTLQWGNQMTGLARSRTPDIVHLSEVSEWEGDPFATIDAALMKAFHAEPTSFMVWESTAAGRGERNFWHVKWRYFTEEWSNGTSPMRPIFVPWFVATDVWPSRSDADRLRPLLADWTPQPATELHAKKARDYVLSDPLWRRELIEVPDAIRGVKTNDWHMPRIQMLYWETEWKQAKASHKLNLMHQELCSSPSESFQNTKMSVFDVEEISTLDGERQPPIAIYGIVGTGIREEFRPPAKHIDRSKKPITIKANMTGEHPIQFELIPLLLDDYLLIDPTARLFIWEEPRDDVRYHVGGDTCYGMDQDRSVMSVMSEATLARDAIQCAEYVNPRMNSVDLAFVGMAIGLYYSVKIEGDRTQPQMDIECNANGEGTQLRMREMGWVNFHRWERYDNRHRVIQNKLGWFTNAWSRPLIIDHVNNAIRDRTLRLNSPWLINDELANLEKDWDEAYSRAARGSHDDRYIGIGIAFFCAHAWKYLFKGAEDVLIKKQKLRLKEAQSTFDGFILSPGGMDTRLPHPEQPDPYAALSDWNRQYYEQLEAEMEEVY